MATPRASSYSVASGAGIFAGVEPPFIPAVGQRANISLNSASDVDYDLTSGVPLAGRWWNGYGGANSFGSMVGSYSGSVWAPQYGSAGAIIVHGGGHGGQIGAFGYAFDFHIRQWTCIGAPGNVPPNSYWCGYTDARNSATQDLRSDPALNIDQRDLQWLDYSYGGSYIKIADHEYLQNAYISPAEGGGPKGSLYLPQSTYSQGNGVADPRTGSPNLPYRWAPHLMSLDTGVMTRASSAPLGDDWASYSGQMSVKDTNRGKLWVFKNGAATCAYHTLGAGLLTRTNHVMQRAAGGNAEWCLVANCAPIFVPEADAIVVFWPTNQNSGSAGTPGNPINVEVYSMDAGVPVDQERRVYAPASIATTYGGLYMAAAWCTTLQRFYLYEGYGDTFLYTCTPSSLDFKTCTWTWGKEQFGGADPVFKATYDAGNAQANAALGKLVWVDAHGCLAWHDGPTTTGRCVDGQDRNGIVQYWHPPGVPI